MYIHVHCVHTFSLCEMLFAIYETTLMGVMTPYLLLMLRYPQVLHARIHLAIHMLYSGLYTWAHFMGMSYICIYLMPF